LHSTEYDTLAH